MMSKNYHKKTDRSRRKMICLPSNAVQVQTANGQARFQMILPMGELIKDVASIDAQVHQLTERRLDGLDIAVILIDGKELGDYTVSIRPYIHCPRDDYSYLYPDQYPGNYGHTWP